MRSRHQQKIKNLHFKSCTTLHKKYVNNKAENDNTATTNNKHNNLERGIHVRQEKLIFIIQVWYVWGWKRLKCQIVSESWLPKFNVSSYLKSNINELLVNLKRILLSWEHIKANYIHIYNIMATLKITSWLDTAKESLNLLL